MQISNKTRLAGLLGVLSAAVLLPSRAAIADAQIGVNINGTPVAFNGTLPIEVNDSVLVPLRGVFEAMGASVDYDSVTHTITARKGATNVVLPLGSTVASVNGQSETLLTPAQVVDGTTLVPLRFVAESFGADVEWQSAQNLVSITTPESHLSALPPAPGMGRIVGQLTGIYTNTTPEQITLRVDGQNTTVPVSDSTVVLRKQPGEDGRQIALTDIQVGDQIDVQRDDNGNATSITAYYGQLRGTVKSIGQTADGTNVITLNDGSSVQIANNAGIQMNGRQISLGDIQADERVLIRTNPTDNTAYEILVNPGNGPNDQTAAVAGGSDNYAAVGEGPTVTSFDVSPTRPLRAGEQLHARLVGAPGCNAVMTIPGVVDNVPMTEASPGIYTADVTVPDSTMVDGAAALAKLSTGGHSSPLIEASERVTVASVAPALTELSPARGATVDTDHPLIYATLADSGIGIDTHQTQISIDGQDVTGSANVTPAFIDVKPPFALQPGDHHVRVTLLDKAGNQAIQDWHFTVASNRLIGSFRADVTPGAILSAGNVIDFTLNAVPGGAATVTIPGIARHIDLHETEPGLYTGSYTIHSGQDATETPVVAHFVARDGSEVTSSLATGINIAAGAPGAPQITSPTDGASVRDAMTISGTAEPNSTVKVKVDYTSALLGGLLPVSGSAGTREVAADANGNWQISDLPLQRDNSLVSDRDTHYTVTAVAIDANGNESPSSQITVQGGHVYAHRTGQGQGY